MKQDLFKNWSVIVANGGVLLGLIVLIIEVSQNTRAIESEAAWARLEHGTALQNKIIDDPAFAEMFFKSVSLTPEEFREGDQFETQRFARYVGTNLMYWETRYITQTSISERTSLRRNITDFLRSPVTRMIATDLNRFNRRTPEFTLYLSEILAEFES